MKKPHTITLYCPHCQYNLTGLRENRCPECGEKFDPDELRRVRVVPHGFTLENCPPISIGESFKIFFGPILLFAVPQWVFINLMLGLSGSVGSLAVAESIFAIIACAVGYMSCYDLGMRWAYALPVSRGRDITPAAGRYRARNVAILLMFPYLIFYVLFVSVGVVVRILVH